MSVRRDEGSNGVGGSFSQQTFEAPDMLPGPIELIGRESELDELLAKAKRRLSAQGPIEATHVSITGVSGVGKSAIAATLAYQLRPQYPDGALYLDVLRQSEDTSQHLRTFLDALLGDDSPPLPPDADLHDRFIRATNRRKIIVFLDNVTDYQRVRHLIPHSPTCLVILTSLERLTPGITPLPLKQMKTASAVELFRAIAPSRLGPAAEPDEVLLQILEVCAGLPIAIRPLAAMLEDDPGYPLGSALEALKTRYESVTGPGPEASFRVSYDRLPKPLKTLFRRLSIVPGESFDITVAAHLAGDVPLTQARDQLDQLRRKAFIEETQDGNYFLLHALLRQFAERMLGAVRDERLSDLLEFYREQAEINDRAIRSLDRVMAGGRTGSGQLVEQNSQARDQALDWMHKQSRNLVAAVKKACERHLYDPAWRISRALVEFFEIRGDWPSWEQTHQETSLVLPDQSVGMAYTSYGLGRLYGSRRDWSTAITHYHRAIATFRLHGLDLEVARSLNALGDVYRYQRSFDAAVNCLTRSQEILAGGDQPRQLAIAKRSMAAIHRMRGHFDKAEILCQEAIKILEDQHDQRWIAATKLSLADIYLDQNMFDLSRRLLEDCLQVFRIFGDTHWLLLTQHSLGEALRGQHDYAGAMAMLQRCQDDLEVSRDIYWDGEVLHSIGQVYLDTGELDQAEDSFVKAMKRFDEVSDVLWQGRTYVSLGKVAARRGDLEQALVHCHTAWPVLVEQGANDVKALEDDIRDLEDELRSRMAAADPAPPDTSS